MKILFLTNNKNTQPLIDWLSDSAKEEVIVWDKKLSKKDIEKIQPDFIVSYNYKFLIKKEIIDFLSIRAINLHISLLPYNRGACPNIWSFLENTPKGVTIHLVDNGIDTGDILLQKEITFKDDKETLTSSYRKLHDEIQILFIENWERIKNSQIISKPQIGTGSTHNLKDFEKIKNILRNGSWNMTIPELKRRHKNKSR